MHGARLRRRLLLGRMVPAVIGLLFDAIGAGITLTDRALTYLENVWHLRPAPYPAVAGDTPPADADAQVAASAGIGGHPVRSTSELLNDAVRQLFWAYDGEGPAVVRVLCSELRLRAAEYAAIGD